MNVLLCLLVASFFPLAAWADELPDDDWNELRTATENTRSIKEENKRTTEPDRRAENERKIAENIGKIETIADRHGSDARAQKLVARTYLEIDEPSRAVARGDRAVALAPQDPEARVIRGRAHFMRRDYAKAAEDARSALRLDPANQDALALLKLTDGRGGTGAAGRASAGSRESAPAAGPAEPAPASGAAARTGAGPSLDAQTAAANRLRASGLLGEASSKMKLGDHAAAKKLLDRALELDEKNAAARLARAKAQIALGQPRGALADAQAVIAQDEYAAEAYLARGQAKSRLGAPADEVLADFRKAAELEPTLAKEYQQALARLKPGADDARSRQARTRESRRGHSPFDQIFGFLPPGARKFVPPLLAASSLLLIFLCAAWLKKHGS